MRFRLDRLDEGGNSEFGVEYFPLSPAQLGIWYAQHVDPQVPINIAQYVELRGDLDVGALERASHDAALELGSGFVRIVERAGEPVQTVDPTLDATLEYIDLRAEADPEAAAQEWMRREYSRPLDIVEDRLIRAAALRLADDHWFWYSRAHHIVLDGFGAMTFMTRIAEHYTANVTGVEVKPAKATELRTLFDQELAYRDSTRFESDRAHWAQRVEGLEEGSSLAGRSAPPAPVNGIASAALTTEQDALLAAAVARHDNSPAGLLIAGFAAYLAQLTGAEDVILSLPVTARTTAAMRRSGGVVSNIVPLRLRVAHETTVAELLKAVTVEVSGALRHQRYRHEDIRRDAAGDGVVTTEFFGPWVNIMLFQNEMVLGPMVGQLNVLSTGSIEDLGVNFYQSAGNRSHIDFETNPNLYSDAEAHRQHTRFLEFFDRFLAADAEAAVWSLPVTTADERELTLVEWNDSEHEVPVTTLPALLDWQIPLTPDHIALDFEGEQLTYAEFGARVNRLARFLIADGVGPESLVALGMRRSLELVIGMHAVLRAGGAYVPIDPDHPAERTAYILDSAAPVCVLTLSYDELELPERMPRVPIDTLDTSAYSDAPVTDADRLAPLRPDNTAYVIYTSGSTGRPKGVAVTHHAIVNQELWMLDEYRLTASDVYLQKTATTFDVSLWGYFLPLLVGAKLVIASPDGHRDPLYVAEMIERHGVTVTDFVPSMLTVFVAHATQAQCATLRAVYVIGEALPPETAAGFRAISSAGLHNLYGPTEAAVSVTYWEATAADTVTVPIGIPEWNVDVYVLDSRLRPAAIGAPGELYLGGRQLARGYRGRPDLSADRFVANPVSGNGSRMYRTGDLVRWTADGVLEYIGRTDFQVKFRGQRIELGEIETVLLRHPAVSQAAALVVDTATGQQLAAYVVPAPGMTVDSAELAQFGAERLPAYMVPAAVVVLDAFPLNTSGKLDRKALPEPVFAADLAGYRAPRTQAEQVVAAIFADVLNLPMVGVEDDFFALGGNSLVATQVMARVAAAFGTRLGVRALFETPTVAGIAARAEAAGGSEAARPPLVAYAVAEPERVPLSLAQQRMWFLNQFDPTVPIYNLPFVMRLHGAIDIDACIAALSDVIERQQSLRTIFPTWGDTGYQQVLPMDRVHLDVEVQTVDEVELRLNLLEFAQAGFDVSRELPIRVRIFEIAGSDDYAVAVVTHHIAVDGFSFGPLAQDMAQAYLARAAGQAPNWTPLAVNYRDFTVWQREVLGAEDDPESLISGQTRYWVSQLADLPDELVLPVDRVRPPVASFRGGRVSVDVSAEIQQRLVVLSRQHNASVFMVLHGALAVLLSRLSGSEDVAIGTPIAGRGEQALDDLVGMFVNTLVLRSRVDGGESFTEFLGRVRETDLAAFGHADVPFERLVEVLNPARSQARHPLFQVMLAVQNLDRVRLELEGSSVDVQELTVDLARFDLQFVLSEAPAGGWTLELTYATDLFEESTAAAIAERWVRVLEGIVADPVVAVGDLDILRVDERAELVARVGVAAEPVRTLPELLAEAVAGDPRAPAVVFEGTALSYAEVDARSNRLARLLIERGVGVEDVVAVTVPRSELSYLATWAIAKSGGAFLPVASDLPGDRVEYMLGDSGARVGVTVSSVRAQLPGSVDWVVLDELDVDGYSQAPLTDSDRSRPLVAQHPAYVIYTSGTTGRPKGVVVTHAGLANFRAEQNERYGLDGFTRALHFASPSFDASILEFLLAVGAGGALVVVPPGVYGGAELAELISAERVTHAMLTPSVLASMDPSALAGLRVVIAGGEAVSADLISKFAADGRRFFNAYGPTEATIASNVSDALSPGDRVTVGAPIRGMQALVLDSRLQPVPVGVAGELYLSGIQLARGYLDRAALTADRFVANPFADGERMYRTGDVVRWTAEGTVEYVGRSDFQVKVRGFRIELGEIDAALTADPDVDFAVTVGHTGTAGVTVLVSYVVAVPGRLIDVAELSADLGRRLPSYMVPSSIVVIDQVPLT
ncbi:amino acid adenylation domain-containing protein, partial [Nocardia sp. NPDC127579]|uniref:amino acid adenylation domain-containing protein n=1 Tax=Nocardia sp. NPDC127579 TaxID=3345402 RepID=UPI00363F01DB